MQKEEQRQERSQEDQETLHRSLRFVEEICCLLKLSRPCTKTSMDYYYHLSNSESHHFQIEIMIGAAIFLSAKVFETERKIRDILNMIFAVTSLHRILRSQQQKNEQITIQDLIEQEGLTQAIQPSYSINNYNQFKSKILEAEQYLLRALGFDFSQSQKNLSQMKTLLIMIHQLRRIPQVTAQAILNIYNDLPFTGIEKWIAGIVFFGYQVGKAALKAQEVKEVVEETIIKDEEWEILFCTKFEKLVNYANKIANYYENKLNEKETQTAKHKDKNHMSEQGSNSHQI